MKHLSRHLAAVLTFALATGLGATSTLAASSASSASLEGASASVGSLSTSVETSSESSSGKTKSAEGPYRVQQVAAAADRPGHVRVALQAVAAEQASMVVVLPAPTAESARLAPGERVWVAARDYGLAFAREDDRQPFFLAVNDSWQRELRTRPVLH